MRSWVYLVAQCVACLIAPSPLSSGAFEMKWFRFYSEFIDDPKIAMMSDSDQLLWVKALCLANDEKQRGCILLSDEEICWKLRISIEQWKHAIDKFRAKGMIDHIDGGYKIKNWDKRQFESDSSAKRVAKHRAKKASKKAQRKAPKVTETEGLQPCNVTVTPPDTDTDTDTEREKDPDRNTEPESLSRTFSALKEGSNPGYRPPERPKLKSEPVGRTRFDMPAGDVPGSSQFMADRPWMESWSISNPTYSAGFVDFLKATVGRNKCYQGQPSDADMRSWLGSANYPSGMKRLQDAFAQWEDYQKQQSENAPRNYVAGPLAWEAAS